MKSVWRLYFVARSYEQKHPRNLPYSITANLGHVVRSGLDMPFPQVQKDFLYKHPNRPVTQITNMKLVWRLDFAARSYEQKHPRNLPCSITANLGHVVRSGLDMPFPQVKKV